MKDFNDLKRELNRINGKGYKAYKDLEGQYDFKTYILSIDHVQGDPFASPSRVRVIVKSNISKFPYEIFDKKGGRLLSVDHRHYIFIVSPVLSVSGRSGTDTIE